MVTWGFGKHLCVPSEEFSYLSLKDPSLVKRWDYFGDENSSINMVGFFFSPFLFEKLFNPLISVNSIREVGRKGNSWEGRRLSLWGPGSVPECRGPEALWQAD